MTHFQIIYKNGNQTLATGNRTHETEVLPSERMITNALHTLCVNNGINDYEFVKAEVYRNGGYLTAYRLHPYTN